MGRKAIGMMCAAFAAGMCFGETINVAAGETLELDLRETHVTNVVGSVITLGAGATLKFVESTPPSTTAGFAAYAMSGGGPGTSDWPKLSDPDPLAKFAWDCYLGVRTNLHWDVTYADASPCYAELNSAKWYVAEAGTYSFFMRMDDFGYLSIDGVPVLASTAACQTLSTNGVALAAGWHDVLIIFGNGIKPTKFGPVDGKAPAIAYNASNVALTTSNVATEGTRFVDPGDGSVFQPVLLPGDFPTSPFFAKVVTEGAATLDASSLGAGTLRWLNGGLRASAGALTVEGVKNIVFGSSATNSYTINYPAFDVPEAVFTDLGATGFTLTNQVTACALPAAPCGIAVADGADVATHGTNTLARLYVDGALELSDWSAYILANTAVPANVPIRVGAGRQLRYKPCYWDNPWTWYGEGGTLTNTVELLDASASLRFSSGQSLNFHGLISGVGDMIHDGGGVLNLHAAASQTGTVSVQAKSKLVLHQNSFGASSNTLLLAEGVAVALDPDGAGAQDTTVHVDTLVGSDKTTTTFNARSRQTVEIGTLKKFLAMNGAADGTSAFVVGAADDAAIFLAPGVKCTIRDILDDNTTAVRASSSVTNVGFYSSSLELANPSRPMKWINLDAGREIVLSGTGTVNSVVGTGTLRLAEGADITIHGFDKTVRLDAGRGKLTILPPLTDWRDKVLLWLDPTDASTFAPLTDNNGVEQTYTNGYKLIEAWYDKRPSQRNFFAYNNRKWSQNKYDLQPQVYPYLVTSGGPNDLPYLSFGTYQQEVPGVGLGGSKLKEARRLQFRRGPLPASGNAADYGVTSEKVAWAVMVFGSQRGGGAAILGTDGAGSFKRAGQALSNPISSNDFTLWADGEQVPPQTSYFNGGWQLLSFDVARSNVTAIAWNTSWQDAGGQNYGEIILFSSKPTDEERMDCEKYLAAKWGLASSAYAGEGRSVTFAGAGDVTLTSGVDAIADGNFSGTLTLSGGTLTIPGVLPPGEADVPSAGRVAWYDPNLPGALKMSTHAERPLCVRALIERNDAGVATGTSYILGTYTATHDRRPRLNVGSRGGSATNWIDFSNIYSGDNKGNTLRRRTGTPSAGEDSSTSSVSVNVRTAFVALDSSNGGGMPLIDTVGADGQIKARVPTTSLSMPIWTNTTVATVLSGTTRLDGTIVDGTNTGYTGWPEILTLETTGNVPICYFGYYGGDQAATPNAEILGEILLYDTLLDDATRTRIEVYLMNKWTGRLPAGYADFRAATVTGSGSVRVPNVANLPSFENFDGTGVVTQAAFAFTLDPSATPAVPDALTVPCALELPAACTATVTCATKPRAGTYTLVSAASFARPTAWTLNAAGTTGNATFKLRATNNALLLDVINPGATIIIR